MESRYITSFAHVQQLRSLDYPEVAFIGRSNCGKSSLLNALMGRKNLAKTSSRPGRTQMIHLFLWQRKLLLADLPGFGYQRTPRKVVQGWDGLIGEYLRRSEVLCCLCLCDIRRDLNKEDLSYYAALAGETTVRMIFTKSDKLSRQKVRSQVTKHTARLEAHGIDIQGVLAVSSLRGLNISELRHELLSMVPSAEMQL